jgi:hypothetical protein
VEPAIAPLPSAVIAVQHLYIGEQVMREVNGLGALQVRVTGDDDIAVLCAEFHERFLQAANLLGQVCDLVAQPHADIEGHLVITRAGGVELGAGGYALGQLGLDVHVHVFEFFLPLEAAVIDLAPDLFQPHLD